jgi:hypothetical protein
MGDPLDLDAELAAGNTGGNATHGASPQSPEAVETVDAAELAL